MDKNVDLYAKTTNIHMEKSIFVICDKPYKDAGAQQFIPMAKAHMHRKFMLWYLDWWSICSYSSCLDLYLQLMQQVVVE